MSRDEFHNGGAFCRTERVLGNTTSESEVDGAWIARESDYGVAMSAKLVINYSAVLADTDDTLVLNVTFRDATAIDGTGADDYYSSGAITVDASNSGGETVTGTAEVDIDLGGANLFIQPQITLVGLAGGTVAYSSVIVFFGDHRQPSTKATVSLGGATSI